MKKNIIKLSVVAVMALSFASCSGNKNAGSSDSTTTTVDSSVSTSTTVDTAKADTTVKDTTKKM